MSVKKKAVGKRVGKPLKKKRCKRIIQPVSKHVHKGYVKAGTPIFFNAPTGKAQKSVVKKKKIYNALNLEIKQKADKLEW